MRTRTVVGIVVTVVALTAAGVSVWILRQPLKATYTALRGEPADAGSVVRFAVVGDNHGDNPVYRQILNELKDEPLDFLLNAADNSEDGTADEFAAVKKLESSLPFPVYHTVGSHDIKADPSRQVFTSAFGQPVCTALMIKGLRLILLDNADRKVGFPKDCLNWLDGELQTRLPGPTILAYHRPFDLPLGQIVGDDETTASRLTNEQFKDIIEGEPIEYIFTAHLHTYIPYTVAGIPAVVTGGGGDPAQTVLGGPKNNLFHYLTVKAQGRHLDVQVHRVELRDAD